MGKLADRAYKWVKDYIECTRHPIIENDYKEAVKAEQDKVLATEQKQQSEQESLKWIRVEDELPEDGQEVLVCSIGWRDVGTAHKYKDLDGNFYWETDFYHKITHWMPIPELPKGGEE